ncbi:hypothetical protein PR048_009449 [Dryococelus australis]|uniref:Uncharacterized protein n=1 Tax=Dryococelus australis TaxID=614101 RepID=A0ABQ9I0V2_9NEOP|nr:hypothetical protein PR048_009449 [Dryococelus australis]
MVQLCEWPTPSPPTFSLRLTMTLHFLAIGRSYEDLKCSTIISPQALGYHTRNMLALCCSDISIVAHNNTDGLPHSIKTVFFKTMGFFEVFFYSL